MTKTTRSIVAPLPALAVGRKPGVRFATTTALGFALALLLAPVQAAWAGPGSIATTPPVVAWKGKKKKKPAAKKDTAKKDTAKKDTTKKDVKPPPEDTGEDAGVPADDVAEDSEGGDSGETDPNRKLPSRADRIGTGDVRSAGSGGTPLRQSNRMEFDARVVRGETAGSGAVILFNRGPRQLAPLTERRHIFLDATITPVLGKVAAAAPRVQHGKSDDKKPKDDKKEADK